MEQRDACSLQSRHTVVLYSTIFLYSRPINKIVHFSIYYFNSITRKVEYFHVSYDREAETSLNVQPSLSVCLSIVNSNGQALVFVCLSQENVKT